MSVFDGTDRIIHQALGLRPDQSLKQKSTCRRLCTAAGFAPELVSRLFERIEGNWRDNAHGRTPSRRNWRQVPQTQIADINKSPETLLEKAIAVLADKGDLPQWCNQVPVASGLIDPYCDKRAALDLVRVADGTADLIELKWDSDTPLFALFEVLRYGLVLLLSRKHAPAFGYSGRPLIQAGTVRLTVLAPAPYYSGYDLRTFEESLNRSLKHLSQKHQDFPQLCFQFLSFPGKFEMPFLFGGQVNAMKAGGEISARFRVLQAISSIQPVYRGAP
ncbi:MAG: hypothetical protein GDA53_01165 [Rhodobacteraceae bacterium]|nr:hypothetical protein [Paracoccaceae bacterium]